VQKLYQGAITSVATARRHVVERNIRERSRAIMRAWSILNELLHSLDHSAGGEISRNLAGLYTYMQTRLLEANSQQSEPPLAEVERLLSTLLEGWHNAILQTASLQGAAPKNEAPLGTAGSDAADTHAEEYVPLSCAY
jgi:flagellar protein FliS